MLRIVKATEPLPVDRVNLCIYSPPGLGKSTLGFTANKPVTLDFDGGAYRAANRKDVVSVNAWADVQDISAADLAPYGTVIVDTAGRALDFLTASIIAGNPKMGRAGALTLQGYGELKAKFTAWLKMLRTFGKDVVLIAHMDEQRNGDDIIERLDVQGGSKAEIYKSVDAMGRLYIRNGERLLDFNPRDNSFGKNPCGLPVMPFDVSNDAFLAEIIATIKDRLNTAADSEKEARQRMVDWTLIIGECKTLDDLNALMPQLTNAPQTVKALALKRGRELNFIFDVTAKQFVKGNNVHAAAGKR